MKMGEHMQPVVALVNELTGNDMEESLKRLAMVTAEYMITADSTDMSVDVGVININVNIEVRG
ncbi:diguanylate phosphodiesterase [Escherichia sp. E2593]|uniref:diguanylate phosphodiesterase n=1 Tax=unclassified Escherichia TaxID=2608889 RepID=UPI0010299AEC|nr:MULTISPECIES: diguanylate phosphodiesterase [unclassified Escherichia]RZN40413.1 diguanylate phosphodiesterase [Escherichia sp. E10V5]TGC06842.1 diguanylate phosphodiesterase [Escherichia sp. E2593]TLI81919.1 diguanylate phosphodiesterase [Escherichia sp. E2593]